MKEKILDFFIRNSARMEKNKVINEIVQSFVVLFPIFIIGAFSLTLQNFPVPAVAQWIREAFDGLLYNGLEFVYDATYGMVAIYVLIVLAFRYSIVLTNGFSSLNVLNTITAIASYMILIAGDTFVDGNMVDVKAFLQDNTSADNIFLAVFVAIVATRLTLWISGAMKKNSQEPLLRTDFSRSVKGMLPMVATMCIFVAITLVVKGLTGYNRVGDLFVDIIVQPFKMLGQNVISGTLLVFVESFVWFFGLHGANMFKELTSLIFVDGSDGIFSKTFLDMYTVLSGTGITIGLIIASLCVVKDREHKKLMGISLIPGIFNINEMVIYGVPVVLNLPLIIPFVLTPVMSFLIAYGATTLGIVPVVSTTVEWTTPAVFSGYMATGSWKGAALQIVIILISVFIYLPFVKLNEKVKNALYEEKIVQLTEMYKEAEQQNKTIYFSTLPNKLVTVAARIGNCLKYDMKREKITIHYQPQHNSEGKVVSSEALLRWKADTDKVIYPPLAVAIAKEFRIYDSMTEIIVEEALADVVRIHKEIGEYIPVSINIDVEQLLNKSFINWVIGRVKYYGIPEGTLGLEITEQQNLVGASNLSEILDKFKEHGIIVSIDDFSMGYTSLAYLQMNQFDYIKLDGGIVKNLDKNERSKDIVDSLINLGKNLGFEVIAEYVENKELQGILEGMGCNKYQGYLYSPAVGIDEYIEYIKQHNL